MKNTRSENTRKKVSPQLIALLSKQTTKNPVNSLEDGKLAMTEFVDEMNHCLTRLSLATREIDLMLEIGHGSGLNPETVGKVERIKKFLQDRERDIADMVALWKHFPYTVLLEVSETEVYRMPAKLQESVLPLRDITSQYYEDLHEARQWIEYLSDLAKSLSYALWGLRWSGRATYKRLFEEICETVSELPQKPTTLDTPDFTGLKIAN